MPIYHCIVERFDIGSWYKVVLYCSSPFWNFWWVSESILQTNNASLYDYIGNAIGIFRVKRACKPSWIFYTCFLPRIYLCQPINVSKNYWTNVILYCKCVILYTHINRHTFSIGYYNQQFSNKKCNSRFLFDKSVHFINALFIFHRLVRADLIFFLHLLLMHDMTSNDWVPFCEAYR